MNYAKIARNTTILLLIVQALSSGANSVMATVTTIIGAQLSGSDALSGVPGAVIQIGSAIASVLLGLTMDRLGRRSSLAAGIGLGAIGSLVAAISITTGSFLWFLMGLTIVGFTRSASLMGRFVAAEVTAPAQRGRAISYVILGGAFGSVLGPHLVNPTGRLAITADLPEFVGPFGAGVVAFLVSGIIIHLFMRPEPRDIGKEIAEMYPESLSHSGPTRTVTQILRTPTALVAVTSMVFGQLVMISLMGITTLYMRAHDHSMMHISNVFSAHTFGMFALSMVTGQLLDRWGRGPVILSGAAMLFGSSVLAPVWTGAIPIGIALFLLGLGWNFTYLGGSALLSDLLTPEERAKTQGANELLISVITAFASFASGLVYAGGGYGMAGILSATAAIIPFSLTAWWMLRMKTVTVT